MQSDGKILVVGYANNGSDNDFAVIRLNSNGSLDNTFDSDGKATYDLGGTDNGNSVAIQSDGKIVVAGYSNVNGTYDFAVIRLNSDGSYDTGFDTDGIVTTPIGTGTDEGLSVAIDGNGKIVVGGFSNNGTDNDFAVVRYNSDGSLDTGFDSDGKVTTDLNSSDDQGQRIALQLDGKIILTGFTKNGTYYQFGAVRYNSNGSLDTGFNSDGIFSLGIGPNSAFGYGVVIQSDGKIVFAGYARNYTGSIYKVALVRVTGSSGPTPVELTAFSALANGDKVNLKWSTATEVNNYGFDVERSSGNESWEKIGFVAGHGNSNSPHNYTFTDQPTGGMSFSYRLKQIDNDGTYKYYDAITVNLDSPDKPELLQNSPNPFNPSTAIKFYIPNSSDVTIRIYDMLGKEVTTLYNKQTEAGSHIVYWNGRDRYGREAASGVYLYRLTAGSFTETKKMNLLK